MAPSTSRGRRRVAQAGGARDTYTIVMQRIGANGQALGHERNISPPDGRTHIEPAIATATDGTTTIAWLAAASGDYQVLARRFTPAGEPALRRGHPNRERRGLDQRSCDRDTKQRQRGRLLQPPDCWKRLA